MTRKSQNPLGLRFEKAITLFRKHGGLLRTADALGAGIHPDTLYRMRDSGALEQVSRGVFRLAEGAPLSNPDLVTVTTRIPKGIVCLVSALSFHDLTTQIPHAVDVALPRGAEPPRLVHPPLRVHRFTGHSYSDGVETQQVDGVRVRVYCAEKTLADCFKFRGMIGLDVALEALRLYRERRKVALDALMRFAAICRVPKTMRPYLEAIL
jgi:predicted transcriptional regulator of viral defense system